MSQPNQPVHVQEKTPKPQGLLPKNVQSWLPNGLAFLMVASMWLTGGKKPQTVGKAASSAATAQAPLEVNETKIVEMQNRIQDLQRQQLLAQSALAQQTRSLSGAPAQDPQPSRDSGAPSEQRPEDQIQAERKKRAYVSLFASNVALSYRKPPASATVPTTEAQLAIATPAPSAPDT